MFPTIWGPGGGGLPRAPNGTGRLSIVRPGWPKGKDGGPYRVRHCSSEQGIAGDGGGLPGTARVMPPDVKRTRLEVYDFSLASTGGPNAGTAVRQVLTFPGVVRPSIPKKTDHEP